jgi:hypothetical protein
VTGTRDRTLTYGFDDDGNLVKPTDDGVQCGSIYATTYDAPGRAFDVTIKCLPGGDQVLEHTTAGSSRMSDRMGSL